MTGNIPIPPTETPATENFISGPFEIPTGLQFLVKSTEVRVYRVPVEEQSRCCYAFPRRYFVTDPEGHPILEGFEQSNWWMRLCCESCHTFEVNFHDMRGNTVLTMEKASGCAPFALCHPSTISVASGSQNYGTVSQTRFFPYMNLAFRDMNDNPQLRLVGPSIRRSKFINDIFKLHALYTKGSIGRITVQHFSGMDNFHIHFPVDLDMRMKALTIGAAVLLDCVYT
ncbi:phospholipid scramblase 1 [Sparganum proliferum]